MSNDGMGNLEKLGILVIVILVVVVGVVAITPTETLFPQSGRSDELAKLPEPLPLPPAPAPDAKPNVEQRHLDPEPLPPWPAPEPEPEPAPVPEPWKIDPKPAPAPEPLPAPAPEPAPEPRFRDVTVQKGDSLWLIAERELGSGSKHRLIQAANPNLDPNRLVPGQVVRIPLDSAVALVDGRRESGSSAVTTSGSGERRYVVQSGDTLMGLSQKFYGSTRHYRFLMEANGLDDPNQLRRDMELRVPDLPTRSANVEAVATRGTASLATGVRTYVVKKGDVPSKIAREQLGDGSRWRELLELNDLDDPRGLRPDMVLKLPE